MHNSELITPQHLARKAVIYIRQSTPHQVVNHQESLRLQYALHERARAWILDNLVAASALDWLGSFADLVNRRILERLLQFSERKTRVNRKKGPFRRCSHQNSIFLTAAKPQPVSKDLNQGARILTVGTGTALGSPVPPKIGVLLRCPFIEKKKNERFRPS